MRRIKQVKLRASAENEQSIEYFIKIVGKYLNIVSTSPMLKPSEGTPIFLRYYSVAILEEDIEG